MIPIESCLTVFVLLLVSGSVHGASPTPTPAYLPIQGNYVVLLSQGRTFNATVSVPAWERLDALMPLPRVLVADDFTMPLSVQSCRALTVDIVFLRSYGATPGNYRAPSRTNLYIYSAGTLVGRFNQSRALYQQAFTAPSEGAWDPPGSSGGETVRLGNVSYHVERLRFHWTNLTLRSSTTYWLAASVSVDLARNTTDESQNMIRIAVSESGTGTAPAASQYQVVDAHGSMYPSSPSLRNWTRAELAESVVLPYETSPGVTRSRTRQLAMDVYGEQCHAVTQVPSSVIRLVELPPRDVPIASPSSLTLSPHLVESPSSLTFFPLSPSGPWPVGPSPSGTGTIRSGSPLPTPSVTVTVSPSVIIVTDATPSPPSSPPPPPSLPSPSSPDAPQSPPPPLPVEPLTTLEKFLIGLSAVIAAMLVIVVLLVFLRCRHRVNYTGLTYGDLKRLSTTEDDDEATVPLDVKYADDDRSDSREEVVAPRLPRKPLPPPSDPGDMLLESDNEDTQQARANDDARTMQRVDIEKK
jgi:hypothetical protein